MISIARLVATAMALLPLSALSCSSASSGTAACGGLRCATPTCPGGSSASRLAGSCCEACVVDGSAGAAGTGSGCSAVDCVEPTCPKGAVAKTLAGSCCPSCVVEDPYGTGGTGSGGAGSGGTQTGGSGTGGSGATTGTGPCAGSTCGDPCYIDPCPGLPCGAAGFQGFCDSTGQCVDMSALDCPGMNVSCPPSPPENGSACTGSTQGFGDISCVWGDDPRAFCRVRGSCQGGAWYVEQPQGGCSEPLLPAACPASPPTSGTTCPDASLSCTYPDQTVCACSACQGGSEYPICQPIDPPEWACAPPRPGCPASALNPGDACTQEGLECGPSCELSIVCEGGEWAWRQGNCPICASPDTPIATPDGERPIADLRVGDLVYSVHQGATVAVPIVRVGSTPVHDHHVVRMTLDDGAILAMSPGHPTADGRPLSSLSPGDRFDDGHSVARAELVPYKHDRTYDILPASDTGAYFAAGAAVGSTLAATSDAITR